MLVFIFVDWIMEKTVHNKTGIRWNSHGTYKKPYTRQTKPTGWDCQPNEFKD